MSLSVSDLLYRWLQTQLPASLQTDNSVPVLGSNAQSSPTGNTTFVGGTSTAPATGSTIGGIGNITGYYRFDVTTIFLGSGTPADVDVKNWNFNGLGSISANINKGVPYLNPPIYLRLNDAPVNIRAGGSAGTASVEYVFRMVVTKLGD